MEKLNNKIFDLSKKYTLITGACGLLGEQHAIALSMINSNLILIDINNKKGIKLKNKLIKKFKKKVLYFNCDITKKDEINSIKSELNKKNIYISVLINNASINPQPNNILVKNDWDDSINVGLTGTKNMIEIFSTEMIKKKRKYN